MADSTLAAIRTKVRVLTRSLSEFQLTTAAIDEYINTFFLYDVPEHLRLFNLKTTFTFYTRPYVDVYAESTIVTDPLYQFNQRYISVHEPVYIGGYQVYFAESRTQFFGIYPLTNNIASIGTAGDGVTLAFSGTINVVGGCLIRNNVLFSSKDANQNGLAMIDYPISATIGNLYVPGGAPTSTVVQDVNNFINYVTGAFTVTFTAAPAAGIAINSQTIPVQPSLPQALLFYDGQFTLRPVPDQVYPVQMEVYMRPTELLNASDTPELQEWWQYVAYGAARKVFQDRMDMDSLAMVEPEYRKQELLVQRRTIVQQTSQRAATIYADQLNPAGAYGYGWFRGGGNF